MGNKSAIELNKERQTLIDEIKDFEEKIRQNIIDLGYPIEENIVWIKVAKQKLKTNRKERMKLRVKKLKKIFTLHYYSERNSK